MLAIGRTVWCRPWTLPKLTQSSLMWIRLWIRFGFNGRSWKVAAAPLGVAGMSHLVVLRGQWMGFCPSRNHGNRDNFRKFQRDHIVDIPFWYPPSFPNW